MSEQREEKKIQRSLKEDLWFGKGVASASTGLFLAGAVCTDPQGDGWNRNEAPGAAEIATSMKVEGHTQCKMTRSAMRNCNSSHRRSLRPVLVFRR